MSSRTSGVAVAVNAAIGGRPAAAVAAPALARGGAEPPVVGPEIVAPLRHAVRLVDDEPRDRQLAQQPPEMIGGESLGRDVEEPQLSGARGAQRIALPLVCESIE